MRMFSARKHNVVPHPGRPVRHVLAGVAASTLVGASALLFITTPVDAAPVTETFTYQGDHFQPAFVPAGITTAQVTVWGAHGGDAHGTFGTYAGGEGAKITGQFSVTPGQQLNLWIGSRGAEAKSGSGGSGGSGPLGSGGKGGTASNHGGGGGGGASAITIGPLQTPTLVAVAGGGGGGGGAGFIDATTGGGGADPGAAGGSSGSTAGDGHEGGGPSGGSGGSGGASTTGAGGAGGTGTDSGGAGGGGGAGVRGGTGGGGAGISGSGGGGGGAGASLIGSQLTSPTLTTGTSVGANGRPDGDGRIDITWLAGPATPTLTLAAGVTTVAVGETPTLVAKTPAGTTGYVYFFDNDIPGYDQALGVATIQTDGTATLTTYQQPLAAGQNHIQAGYEVGNNQPDVLSNTVTVTVTSGIGGAENPVPTHADTSSQTIEGSGTQLSTTTQNTAATSTTADTLQLAQTGTSQTTVQAFIALTLLTAGALLVAAATRPRLRR